MRLKRHAPLLESALKHARAQAPQSLLCVRCRRYASSSAAYPEQIAILGGGISGLASAHFISKELPNSKITIYEENKKAGGWIKSRRFDVPGGNVLFEFGPRSLRPGYAALPTAQLIQDLDLVSSVIRTEKDSASAKNRYIYYPDRLNRLPASAEDFTISNSWKLASSGMLDGVWKLLKEAWVPKRPASLTDESIGSFLSRRVDERIANNVVSAVMHGIYAGDIWKLSARTLMSLPWQYEGKYGSIMAGVFNVNSAQPGEAVPQWHPYALEEYQAMRAEIKVEDSLKDALSPRRTSTFTFKDGLQQLVLRLKDTLEANPQVEIRTDCPVNSVEKVKGTGQLEIVAGKEDSPAPRQYDFVVNTLPHTLPKAPLTDTVTVMVVNLYFDNPKLLPVSGFGYLIPQSVPFEQNPERALGVIFDSDAIPSVDGMSPQDTVAGTKLTVMLGGHWWDGWQAYPDREEGLDLARSVIRRHLNIDAMPSCHHVTLNENAIPQYTVGYEDRLKDYATMVRTTSNGKVRVIGSQFNGVGVNDCIKAAWSLARGMRGNGWRSQSGGPALDKVLDERPWVSGPSGTL